MTVFIGRLIYSSVAASIMIIVMLIARPLLKRLPKRISLLLWLMVCLRLILPVSISSPFSPMPAAEKMGLLSGHKDSVEAPEGSEIIKQTEATASVPQATRNENISHSQELVASGKKNATEEIPEERIIVKTQETTETTAIIPEIKTVIIYIWPIGCAGVLLYMIIGLFGLRKRIKLSVPAEIIYTDGYAAIKDVCQGNCYLRKDKTGGYIKKIYVCEEIRSPFILGLFDPKLYIPVGMDAETLACVIRHEHAHIRHMDPFWKLIAEVLAAVYWFNPFVWIGFVLFSRDIELACDERVARNMTDSERIAYSEALLSCGSLKRTISICSVSFGETGVRERVKLLLSNKKPSKWNAVAAVMCCVIFAGCFFTNTEAEAVININADPLEKSAKNANTDEDNGKTADTYENSTENTDTAENKRKNVASAESSTENTSGLHEETTIAGKASEKTNENLLINEDRTGETSKTEDEELKKEQNKEKDQEKEQKEELEAGPKSGEKEEDRAKQQNNGEQVKNTATGENAIIPDGVTRIRAKAFFFVLSMKTVVIPDSVTEIGNSAFSHCENLERITISTGVRNIPQNCFESCFSLEEVGLPENIESIEDYAFADCYELQYIIIPDSVKEIGKYAFKGCSSLSRDTISKILEINPEAVIDRETQE